MSGRPETEEERQTREANDIIKCPLSCGFMLKRKDMGDHVVNWCLKRDLPRPAPGPSKKD